MWPNYPDWRKEQVANGRVVIWFSCGITSAVAAKLAVEKYKGTLPIAIVYADTGSEHPDNHRFLKDVESWLGEPIIVMRSEKYQDIWEVFEKTKYLVGVGGARCTSVLKKAIRNEFQEPETDIQIFGFDMSEQMRAIRFAHNNLEVFLETPLIDNGLSKADCIARVQEAGIEIPVMYKLGYKNNNCIGCVKGQTGYWNKIRKDFPEVFDRMAKLERQLNVAINKTYAGDGKRKRVFLDELDPEAGRYQSELPITCGILCDTNPNDGFL